MNVAIDARPTAQVFDLRTPYLDKGRGTDMKARTERMKAANEDWFNEFMLPRAVLALKQGFGRLIRTRSDRGVVAILDRRLLTHRYGETILRSLPPARRIDRIPDRRPASSDLPPVVNGSR